MWNLVSSAVAGLIVAGVVSGTMPYDLFYGRNEVPGIIAGIVVFILLFARRRKGGVTSTVAEVAAATMNKKDEIAEKYQELRKGKAEKV